MTSAAATSQTSNTDDVSLGDPLQWETPEYPKLALENRIQGSVVLRITASKEGTVKDVGVVSGDPVLAKAAVKAVHEWKFVPYFRDDKPTEAQTRVTIDFKITDAGQPKISAKYVVPKAPPFEEDVKIKDGVTPPKLLYQVSASYTKSAQADKVQGTVVISAIIGSDGVPRNISVARSLRSDLDSQALAAVSYYRFAAATRNGKRVPVMANIEVTFHLY
ncbi:MAG TPA: energy transducer TonB [Terriglobales bacterium]